MQTRHMHVLVVHAAGPEVFLESRSLVVMGKFKTFGNYRNVEKPCKTNSELGVMTEQI